MIEKNTLAWYGRDKGSYKPSRRAHNFRAVPKNRVALLWGDPVYVIDVAGGEASVSAKGHHLDLPLDHLTDQPILCLYQIDCGQGDAALVQFPDDRWMMVDAGPPHDWSNSGKIAPDFLYWKMFVDQSWKAEFGFRKRPFHLDAVVCTHPDYDHYGGFLDMTRQVEGGALTYGTVFHCGLGRFSGPATAYANGRGHSQLGPVEGEDLPEAWLTTLIDGFDDVAELEQPQDGRPWKLTGSYGGWLSDLRRLQNGGVGDLRRVDHATGFLPGYEPRDGRPSVKVLGPVVEHHRGRPGLRYLDTAGKRSMGGPSLTRNGHSIVLRIDYGQARILLTGDLNFRSQALLLRHVDRGEFRCDVGKACHHGSEDVSWSFLQAMEALAVMFSSGDNESYAHPRARVLGLTGAMGRRKQRGKNRFLGLTEERLVAPLVYSTELSRSIALHPPYAAYDGRGDRVGRAEIQVRGRTRASEGRRRKLEDWLLGDRMVYGLINLRTDGKRILMGVLKEDDASFQVEELRL